MQAWFRPREGWIHKAYLLSSETLSLSLYSTDKNHCRGLLLEIAGGPSLSYPTPYITCRYGPKILSAQVNTISARAARDSALVICRIIAACARAVVEVFSFLLEV
jgi:hypothetical protein